jgi:hypothetical protein
MSNINVYNVDYHRKMFLKKRRSEFKIFLDLIKERHGKCLSVFTNYKTIHSKLTVECAHRHSFEISLHNIQYHKWCDICRLNLGDLLIIKCLEFMFNRSFTKTNFNWLRTYEKINVEDLNLDNYNEELNLAVEHCNSQSRNQDLYNVVKIFEYKKKDVKVITVSSSIELQTIHIYLINECQRLGYSIDKFKMFKWTDYIK